MMLHGKTLLRHSGNSAFKEDIMIPPACLADGTAKCLLGAIQKRASWFFDPVGGSSLTCTILNSDSAASLINVGHHSGSYTIFRKVA